MSMNRIDCERNFKINRVFQPYLFLEEHEKDAKVRINT